MEERAWADTDTFYAARLADLAEMAQPSLSSSISSKAKGKRKAEESESETLPRLDELPERYRSGANVALKVVAEGLGDKTPLAQQFDRLQFEVCTVKHNSFTRLIIQFFRFVARQLACLCQLSNAMHERG